jgi:hypothetical protein
MVSTLILGMALLMPGQQPKTQTRPPASAQPADPRLLAGYNTRRAKAADTADAYWKLGIWCEQNGLKAEAEANFMLVLQRDSARDAAWKKLGYVKHNGRWSTPEQVAAERAELETQRKADAHWRPILQKWKAALARKDRRSEAEAALAEVKDPRATPSIWRVFAVGNPDDQERAIDMLGHTEGERPLRALAGLAIFGKTDMVRRDAVETLKRRKADDVLMAWIGLLRSPTKYEIRQVAGPGSPGMLYVEGEKFNVRGFYAPPSAAQTQTMFVDPLDNRTMKITTDGIPRGGPPIGSKVVGHSELFGDLYVFDYTWAPPPPPPPPPGPTLAYQQYEMSVLQAEVNREFMFGEANKMAAGAQAQLEHDMNMLEQANGVIRERNARVSEALRQVSGVDLGEDREAWTKWWMNRMGYSYSPPKDRPKVTVDVQVALPYVPASGPPRLAGETGGDFSPKYCMVWEHEQNQVPRLGKCFRAGTTVLTPCGLQAIETLEAGDLVIAADELTGERHSRKIVSVHVSRSARTLRLMINGEAVVTTEGHPFQRPGTGWTPAGDLEPGDEVLTLQGKAHVEEAVEGEAATVWNLRLAGGSSFLVGRLGVVVHDLSPIEDAGTATIFNPSRARQVRTLRQFP